MVDLKPFTDDFLRIFGGEIALALAAAIVYCSKHARQKLLRAFRKRSTPLEYSYRDDLAIMLELKAAIVGMAAMRVYLSKYHNGEHFDDSSDIRKKSRTHEVVADGVNYQADEYKNVLTSSVPDETQLVLQAKLFSRVADLPEGNFRWRCERGATKAIARIAIRRGKYVIAFVGADFSDEVQPATFKPLLEAARNIAQRIGGTVTWTDPRAQTLPEAQTPVLDRVARIVSLIVG
ncbi:MAG TPA: hypothetical protein VGN72_14505 [Tepidisphaeraceae bacterium]|jgi:hypothetical protein|nr:hypothetical protein [Tepidisphaeraceae bacterium]